MHDSSVPIATLLRAEFEGAAIHVLSVDGRPAWVAREVGAAIGYATGGKRLVSLITDEWSEEFIEGHDYLFVEGEALAALKGANEPGATPVRSPTLLLLFEPGLHLVLTKTSKPIGRRLRRFLVDEVLPRLVRGEEPPAPAETGIGLLINAGNLLAASREARLTRRVDLDDRRYRAGALSLCVHLLHAAGRLDDAQILDWEVRVAEVALGQPLPELRALPPQPPGEDDSLPAVIIGRVLGVSPERVRRAVVALGRKLPAESDPYDPSLVAEIEELLITQGFLRPRAA
jgi:hypothetical protein